MLSKSTKKLIKQYCEITVMERLIDNELHKLGLVMNNYEQRYIINNRYIIQYNKLVKRSISHDNIQKFNKQKFVRQHSI